MKAKHKTVSFKMRIREAHPQFGDDQFDEVLVRLQLMF